MKVFLKNWLFIHFLKHFQAKKGNSTGWRQGRSRWDPCANVNKPKKRLDNIQEAAIEGYLIIVTNVDAEAQEEDIFDHFSEYGEIKTIHLNLDRRTGYVKGYALVMYENYSHASKAVKSTRNHFLL